MDITQFNSSSGQAGPTEISIQAGNLGRIAVAAYLADAELMRRPDAAWEIASRAYRAMTGTDLVSTES